MWKKTPSPRAELSNLIFGGALSKRAGDVIYCEYLPQAGKHVPLKIANLLSGLGIVLMPEKNPYALGVKPDLTLGPGGGAGFD